MELQWTDSQHQRLVELDAPQDVLALTFDDADQRNRVFQEKQKAYAAAHRRRLDALRVGPRRPGLCRLETTLTQTLVDQGFVQVATPTIMSAGLLAKMGVTPEHPLHGQVYWVEKDKCLRPMLAPHLYFVLKDLLRLWERPISIFEVGSCFRKETDGASHCAEFTMLNLCEFGLPEEKRQERIEFLADLMMKAAGIANYALETETSAVYGTTLDVVSAGGLELGSGAMGPHPLDRAWRISDTWVGIGFGLERLLMAAEGSVNLSRFARSITYLDGVRLNIQ